MSIDCAFFGFLSADADPRQSSGGRDWVRLRVGIGQGTDIQWVQVAVFGKAAEAAKDLKKADRIYVEGTIKLSTWTHEGKEFHGLSVAAFKCEQTHNIGKRRRRHTNRVPRPAGDGDTRSPPPEREARPFNDTIPL